MWFWIRVVVAVAHDDDDRCDYWNCCTAVWMDQRDSPYDWLHSIETLVLAEQNDGDGGSLVLKNNIKKGEALNNGDKSVICAKKCWIYFDNQLTNQPTDDTPYISCYY